MPHSPWLDHSSERGLLAIAGWAIAEPLGLAEQPPAALPAQLAELQCGCFVTLERGDELRGCIGQVESDEPLATILPELARRAAFGDPRFAPLRKDEVHGLTLTISLLSPRQPLEAGSSLELARQLVPGEDGLWLADAGHGATFLPSVWRHLPDPEQFIAALLRKGGWGHWPRGLRAWRYHSHAFSAPLDQQW